MEDWENSILLSYIVCFPSCNASCFAQLRVVAYYSSFQPLSNLTRSVLVVGTMIMPSFRTVNSIDWVQARGSSVLKQGNLFCSWPTIIIPRYFDCIYFVRPLLPLILANLKFCVAYLMSHGSSSSRACWSDQTLKASKNSKKSMNITIEFVLTFSTMDLLTEN